MQNGYVVIVFGLEEISGDWVAQVVIFRKIDSTPFWTIFTTPGEFAKNDYSLERLKKSKNYLFETIGPPNLILPPVCL